MLAYEIQANCDAGMIMVEVDGQVEWMGDWKQRALADELQEKYAEVMPF